MIIEMNVKRFLESLAADLLFSNQTTRSYVSKFDPAELIGGQ